MSDVGCSTALLQAALRERAARAGGTFLVDVHCDAAQGELEPGSTATCSANVWGPSNPAGGKPAGGKPAGGKLAGGEPAGGNPAGGDPDQVAGSTEPLPVNVDARGPAAPLAPAFGAVEEAWRVLVDYWPVPRQKARTPVGSDQVSEIDFPRVGFTRLGDVRARADESCSLDTVRGALRAAAARVGATSVVGVRCIAEGDTQSCVASVAAAEVNEPIAEAR